MPRGTCSFVNRASVVLSRLTYYQGIATPTVSVHIGGSIGPNAGNVELR